MTVVRNDGATMEDLIKALLSVLNSKATNGLGLPEQLYSHAIAAVADRSWDAGLVEDCAIEAKNLAKMR